MNCRWIKPLVLAAPLLLTPVVPAEPPLAVPLQSEPATACVKSVCFPATARIAEQDVPYRGGVHFRYWGFEVYTVAFFAPDAAKGRMEMALAPETPRQLVLHYHRTLRRGDFIKSGERFIGKNPNNDLPALRERLDRINALYRDVKDGDRYSVRYEPGVGTTLLLNDEALGPPIPGADFARAYFGIWLSEQPISTDMRDTLLGVED